MGDDQYPATPELDKIGKVQERSQAIGEFLEWAQRQGFYLCQYREEGTNGKPRRRPATPDDLAYIEGNEPYGKHSNEYQVAIRAGVPNEEYAYWPEGWYLDRRTTHEWLEHYFGIDGEQAERERAAVLAYVREQNAKARESEAAPIPPATE